MNVERGHLGDRFPYVRVGSGDRPLAVFPGLDDAMFDGEYSMRTAWACWWYFARFLDDHTVYVLSRPRGLPDDHTVADMADDYAEALAEVGRADVLGVSVGGLAALALARRHPDRVRRLVLANSGCRLVDRDAVERFRGYANDQDWARIRAELSGAMFADWRGLSYPALALTTPRRFHPEPADPADVLVSLRAVETFDAGDWLDEVAAPTLVFGGSADPFFPERVLRETAAGIPDATLSVIQGAKHAAFHERKPRFDARVDAFLSEQRAGEGSAAAAPGTRA